MEGLRPIKEELGAKLKSKAKVKSKDRKRKSLEVRNESAAPTRRSSRIQKLEQVEVEKIESEWSIKDDEVKEDDGEDLQVKYSTDVMEPDELDFFERQVNKNTNLDQ